MSARPKCYVCGRELCDPAFSLVCVPDTTFYSIPLSPSEEDIIYICSECLKKMIDYLKGRIQGNTSRGD